MRLIDADEMQKYINEHNDINEWCVSQYSADWISSFIENRPTVDIKNETAREIFVEIEKYMVVFGDANLSTYFRGIGWKVFAELKNKYTKEGVGE